MRSFQSGAEPGSRTFESIESFLQVMLDDESAEVAAAASSALGRWGVEEEEDEHDDELEAENMPEYPIDDAGHAVVPDGVLALSQEAFVESRLGR